MQNKRGVNKTKRRLFIYFVMIGIISVLVFAMIFLVYVCFFALDGESNAKNSVDTNVEEAPVVFTQQEALEKENEKLFCVVLDAGHGGKDSGAINGSVEEKNINLSVALKLKSLLKEYGIDVILTREDDEFIELSERIELANDLNADLFVSLHCNSFEDISVKGFECYYAEDDYKSQRFAEKIINISEHYDEIATRTAKIGEYYVLTNARVPSVLVEMGFITNSVECEKLENSEYQMLLCEIICEGILKVLETKKTQT